MFALLDIRTIAAFVFNIQIIPNSFPNRTPPPDNALQKFFGQHQLCPAENTVVRVRRYGAEIGEVGRYRTWFASRKLLKHVEFTGSGDVWGDGSGKICFTKWQKVV